MDKQHIPIYVPAPLVERIDAVAFRGDAVPVEHDPMAAQPGAGAA
jgi:hypothetical protein